MSGIGIARSRLKRGLGTLKGPRTRPGLNGEEGVATFAHGRRPVGRLAVINHLCALHGHRSYLEIGVRRRAENLESVLAPERVGVDPDPDSGADFVMSSDAFFAAHPDRRFDLVFIDGLHTGEQVARDLENALAALNPGGSIVLHDLNPPTAAIARERPEDDPDEPNWCGSCWRGWASFRAAREDLSMHVVDTDWGCGVVRAGRQAPYRGPRGAYADLAENRAAMLNLISVADFLRLHPVGLGRRCAIALRA